MAIDNDKLKKAEEILNRIKEAQKVVGGKPLFNIDPQKLSQSTEEMEKMSLAADALENKADAINSSFGDMKSTLQAVADEMEKGDKRASVYQRRVKQSVGSLTKIAEKLSSEEKGYGIESDKNIDKLIKKAQEQKDFAKSQANQLANEVGLVKNITGGYDKRTKAYKEHKAKLEAARQKRLESKKSKFVEKVKESIDDFNREIYLEENNMNILKDIVVKKQAKPVKFSDGTMKVDMFTASAITQVYNKVNIDNKKKLEKMVNGTKGQFGSVANKIMKMISK